MSGKRSHVSAAVKAAWERYHITGLATGADWADVAFQLDANPGSDLERTVLDCGGFISAEIRAYATTQAVDVRVLHRPTPDYPWEELVAETSVAVGTVTGGILASGTEVLKDTLRTGQIKIQVKRGASAGGALTLAAALK